MTDKGCKQPLRAQGTARLQTDTDISFERRDSH